MTSPRLETRTAYSVSVITPVYNEVTLLRSATATILDFLGEHFDDYELILVESGSTDGSSELCTQLAAEDPRIRVFHEGARRGFGSALKLGYRSARKDLVWTITADQPFPLSAVLAAIPLLDRYECVLSFRSQDDRGWQRRVQSAVYNALVTSLLGLRVRHVNSAFKLYKRDVLLRLPYRSDSWFIDAEIIYHLTRAGIPFTEIPVELIDRTEGHSSITLRTPVALLKELWQFARSATSRVAPAPPVDDPEPAATAASSGGMVE